MIKVLVADDQDLVRVGSSMILEAADDIEVTGEAEDGRRTVELATSLRPDVVLMDIRMPVLDGIAATRELVRAQCPSRVLVLTTFDLDEYVYAAMREVPADSCSRRSRRRSSSTPSAWWRRATRCSPRRSRGASSSSSLACLRRASHPRPSSASYESGARRAQAPRGRPPFAIVARVAVVAPGRHSGAEDSFLC